MLLLGVVQAQAAAPVSAGSYDLLATTILTSTQATVTLSGLSTYATDYQHLQIRVSAQSSTSQVTPIIRFNGDTAFANYRQHFLQGNGSSVSSGANQDSNRQGIQLPSMFLQNTTPAANQFGAMVIDILDPFSTSKNTTVRAIGGNSGDQISLVSGVYLTTNALTSATFSKFAESGGYAIGSRFSLYGLKGSA
jgi:hypothetical protein